MITVLSATVTLPAWLFLVIVAALIGFIAFVLWANETQRKDNQRLRRRLLLQDPEKAAAHILDELRNGGER